jgi:hypothetical protein
VLASDEAVGDCPVPPVAARSRPAAATESDAPSELLAFAASGRMLPASGLAVAVAAAAGCGAALLSAGVVDSAGADLSDALGAVSEAEDVVALTSAATEALAEAVFGTTGAAASTRAGNDRSLTAVALVGAVACFAGVATASLAAACTLALAVTAASTVIPVVAVVGVGAAGVVAAGVAAAGVAAGSDAAEPSLGWTEVASGAAPADELAAMAAAAMASGVEPAEAEAATATLAGATVTGIGTAIAFSGVNTIAAAPSCCVGADGSVEEGASEESVPADFAVPAFEVPDLPSDLVLGWGPDGWEASLLPLELAALFEAMV